MYKVSKITISGFWGNYCANANFSDDVNILIGKNGSGKTTFMDILHAILTIDVDRISEITFSEAVIKLGGQGRGKTVKIEKIDKIDGVSIVKYKISNKKTIELPIITGKAIRLYPLSLRRKIEEGYEKLKGEFRELVSVASLSVYRNNYEYEFDRRDYSDFKIAKERGGKYSFSPVDEKLNNLLERLTKYQLELSSRARNISIELQKQVLLSLLEKSEGNELEIVKNFDPEGQKKKLIDAYKNLGLDTKDVVGKIADHINLMGRLKESIINSSDNKGVVENDFSALDAQKRMERIIELSLAAEKKINEVSEQLDLYLNELSKFMDKKFEFSHSGDLRLADGCPLEKLSSGEKQLLILLTEALLQKEKNYIFLADEPEISLHIEWQKRILPSVMRINPNAQIIVATHSPEIAGGYPEKIVSMKEILSKAEG